jgi:hypothetical protein
VFVIQVAENDFIQLGEEREERMYIHKWNGAHSDSDVAILLPSYVHTHSIHKRHEKNDGMECWSASLQPRAI